jgi:23S rRNA pseudouridine1911/1915/1917 synthase
MELIYCDEEIVVCVKPARVLSTDEPGGMPELVRQALGTEDVRTVHRLDRVVSGLMVLARTAEAAAELSRQIRDDEFEKEYLAITHGNPEQDTGKLCDLLYREKARKMTMVVTEPGKDVQPAALRYQILGGNQELTRVRIQLETGRTHQIRVQFASRGFPLVGERKYSELNDPCEIALWSYRLAFTHPITGQPMEFVQDPPAVFPWTEV